ncbi:transcription factor S-II, central domain-domain-containing protein [Naematelia encephala]|uniref:Transcription elongation factor n=1 Tax=Naematelia encephala TaxID=71784 RepID=A0A1Y2BE20_9TREE|nr:transcription factor S-II, central domain-domain-containing protein [Naematelia encephala]
MDVEKLSGLVKDLNEANTANKTDDVLDLLARLKNEVKPTEDLLRQSKAGLAIGKLRKHADTRIASRASEVVKVWKEVIDESKGKRKREEGDVKDEVGKRVKVEAGPSTSASPSAASPSIKSESKPRIKSESKPDPDATPTPAPETPLDEAPPKTLTTIDMARKTPRTHKTDGYTAQLKAEENDGEDVRDKSVQVFYDALAGDSTADKRLLGKKAAGIERAVWKSFNFSTGNDYRAKVRSLFLNLKEKTNPGLRDAIVTSQDGFAPEDIAVMSKEAMASDAIKAMNQALAEENLFKAKAVGETTAETDAFKCGKCGARKTTYYQMQTRSADEPMTTFVTCTNCKNRWKFS